MEYFDFVLVKHDLDATKSYLFRAPAFSKLEKGDFVVVETKKGNKTGFVEACLPIDKADTQKIDFIMNATGASKEIKRVLSKVQYIDFDYSGEVGDEKGGNATTP